MQGVGRHWMAYSRVSGELQRLLRIADWRREQRVTWATVFQFWRSNRGAVGLLVPGTNTDQKGEVVTVLKKHSTSTKSRCETEGVKRSSSKPRIPSASVLLAARALSTR
jgi:hypothetical protein